MAHNKASNSVGKQSFATVYSVLIISARNNIRHSPRPHQIRTHCRTSTRERKSIDKANISSANGITFQWYHDVNCTSNGTGKITSDNGGELHRQRKLLNCGIKRGHGTPTLKGMGVREVVLLHGGPASFGRYLLFSTDNGIGCS